MLAKLAGWSLSMSSKCVLWDFDVLFLHPPRYVVVMLLAGSLLAFLGWLVLVVKFCWLVTGGVCVGLWTGTLGYCNKLAIEVATPDVIASERLMGEGDDDEKIEADLAAIAKMLGRALHSLADKTNRAWSSPRRTVALFQ
jgi:hypothetical protein